MLGRLLAPANILRYHTAIWGGALQFAACLRGACSKMPLMLRGADAIGGGRVAKAVRSVAAVKVAGGAAVLTLLAFVSGRAHSGSEHPHRGEGSKRQCYEGRPL